MDATNITVNIQNSILVDVGKKIYFDPYKIEKETHDADYIFITHDHYDHFSMPDIMKILDEKTVFVIPAQLEKRIRKSTPVGSQICVVPGQKYETPDFTFETVAMYNKLKPFHPKNAGWCGYNVTIDGTSIYVAGDIDAIDEAKAVKCDIAMIPIGGFYTMNYKEGAKLINQMKPKIAIPTHYGDIVGEKSNGEDFKNLVDDGTEVVLKLY